MRKRATPTGIVSYFDYMATSDGAVIRYGVWRSRGSVRRGTVVLLSGRSEFLEKYGETIGELNARGWDVYSFDWRGQGLSTRMLPNPHKGHIEDYEVYLSDLDRFLHEVVLPLAVRPVAALAHSMGAHILLRYLVRRGDIFSRVVLTSPMIDIYAGPFPVAAARMLTQAAIRLGRDHAYAPGEGDYRLPGRRRFKNNRLTSDGKRYVRSHRMIAQNPDLALGGVTFGWLRATFDSIDALASPGVAASIPTPVLIVSSGSDRVVQTSAQTALCSTLPDYRFVSIPGARHEILMERDPLRAAFWRAFDDFMSADPRKRGGDRRRHSESMAESASQRS